MRPCGPKMVADFLTTKLLWCEKNDTHEEICDFSHTVQEKSKRRLLYLHKVNIPVVAGAALQVEQELAADPGAGAPRQHHPVEPARGAAAGGRPVPQGPGAGPRQAAVPARRLPQADGTDQDGAGGLRSGRGRHEGHIHG